MKIKMDNMHSMMTAVPVVTSRVWSLKNNANNNLGNYVFAIRLFYFTRIEFFYDKFQCSTVCHTFMFGVSISRSFNFVVAVICTTTSSLFYFLILLSCFVEYESIRKRAECM